MRTPWRFVADLVSRKPKSDASDDTRSADAEIKTLEYHPSNEGPPADVKAMKPVPPPDVDRKDETDATSAAPDLIAEISTVSEKERNPPVEAGETPVPQPASARDTEASGPPAGETAATATLPGRQRRKTSGHAISRGSAVITPEAEAPAAPIVPKTLIEQMAELDTEVDVLRRQLATKLGEQNAQLRKMLERYEVR